MCSIVVAMQGRGLGGQPACAINPQRLSPALVFETVVDEGDPKQDSQHARAWGQQEAKGLMGRRLWEAVFALATSGA